MKEEQSQSFLADSAKMLIISDSHGYLKADDLQRLIKKEKSSALIHLGDLIDKFDESYKGDFEALIEVLKTNPFPFIHVSGGLDTYYKFDSYIQSRERAFSGSSFKENEFIMHHYLNPELKKRLTKETPHFILHGHTHIQDIAYLNYQNKLEEIPIRKDNEIRLILKPNSKINYFLNPGAFKNGEYCTLEKKGNFYSAIFKSF